jgi:hypothetical protein
MGVVKTEASVNLNQVRRARQECRTDCRWPEETCLLIFREVETSQLSLDYGNRASGVPFSTGPRALAGQAHALPRPTVDFRGGDDHRVRELLLVGSKLGSLLTPADVSIQ